MRAFVYVAIAWVACAESDRAAESDVREPDPSDPGLCVASDPCARGTCVELCGDRVVVRAGDPWTASAVARGNLPPRSIVRIGDKVVQLDGATLVVRDAQTLALRGALWLGWYARELTPLSDTRVALQTSYGTVFVDVDGAGRPSIGSVWESVRLLAGQADRVAVATSDGFAIVDASAPNAPRAIDCAEWPLPGEFFPSQTRLVDGRLLIVGSTRDDGGGAWIYDVDQIPMSGIAQLLGDTPLVTLEGDRLVMFGSESASEGIMFEVGPHALTELWRYPGVTGSWSDAIVGGMLALGGAYEVPQRLIDLQADGPETYQVVAEVGCGWVVQSDLTGDRVGLEVWGDRSLRVAPEAIRTSGCERNAMGFSGVQSIVRDPASARVLAVGDAQWWWLDAETYEDSVATTNGRLDGTPLWAGAAIYAIGNIGGGDWSLPVPTTIGVLDPADLSQPARPVARAFTGHAYAAGDRLWALTEPAVRIYDGPRSPIAERIIWSVGGADPLAIEDHPELDDLAPIAIAAFGDTLWVLDDGGFVRRWRAGALADSEPLARFDQPTLVASSLGLFITDAAGALAWIDASLQPHVAAPAAECVTRTVVAADDDHVYVREQRPGFNPSEPASELIVATPQGEGGALRLDVVARVPGAPRVFVGDPVILVDGLGLRSLRFTTQ